MGNSVSNSSKGDASYKWRYGDVDTDPRVANIGSANITCSKPVLQSLVIPAADGVSTAPDAEGSVRSTPSSPSSQSSAGADGLFGSSRSNISSEGSLHGKYLALPPFPVVSLSRRGASMHVSASCCGCCTDAWCLLMHVPS